MKIGTYEYENKTPKRVVVDVPLSELPSSYFKIETQQDEDNWLSWKVPDTFWEYKWA
jgi:hypothetical protein